MSDPFEPWTFNRQTGDIKTGDNLIVAYVSAHAYFRDAGHAMAAARELLTACRVARGYMVVALEEFREEQDDLEANEPNRPAKARAEDAETFAQMEQHLRQIDAAIAKASPV